MSVRAAVAGATGLVGGFVLKALLADAAVERVVATTRRPLAPHPKLVNRVGSGWPDGERVDEAYCCLGTTRKDAGSDEAFRAVDFDLTLAFALAAAAAGARRFGLVSSVGANARSRFLYPRVKGEAEVALGGIAFESLVIVRPALLLGAREKPRTGEALGEAAFGLASPLLVGPLRKYRPVEAATVAAALVRAVRGAVPGRLTLESDALQA